MAFNPALLVVDMQNDFCSTQGLNPVSGNGMDLVAPIKQLLSMPGFTMRAAALNEITDNNKAFAHNHKGATAHETHIDLPNTKKGMSDKTVKQMLLRKGCIKGTWGAKLVDGLPESAFDLVIRRNSHSETWM